MIPILCGSGRRKYVLLKPNVAFYNRNTRETSIEINDSLIYQLTDVSKIKNAYIVSLVTRKSYI